MVSTVLVCVLNYARLLLLMNDNDNVHFVCVLNYVRLLLLMNVNDNVHLVCVLNYVRLLLLMNDNDNVHSGLRSMTSTCIFDCLNFKNPLGKWFSASDILDCKKTMFSLKILPEEIAGRVGPRIPEGFGTKLLKKCENFRYIRYII